MNKQQIKEELRRSACEDYDPWDGCKWMAWVVASDSCEEFMRSMIPDDCRTFFLLVAEAL